MAGDVYGRAKKKGLKADRSGSGESSDCGSRYAKVPYATRYLPPAEEWRDLDAEDLP